VIHGDSEVDLINDFSRSDGAPIDLRSTGLTSFSQVQALLSQAGNDAVLTLSSGAQFRLLGLQASSLTSGDFVFATSTAATSLAADDASSENLPDAASTVEDALGPGLSCGFDNMTVDEKLTADWFF
jgi:hypothetical protein